MKFSRQEYWNGLPFPPPEKLPDPGIEPWSPSSQAYSLPFELQGSRSILITAPFQENVHEEENALKILTMVKHLI